MLRQNSEINFIVNQGHREHSNCSYCAIKPYGHAETKNYPVLSTITLINGIKQ